MFIPREAIEKALQGGWKSNYDFVGIDDVFVYMVYRGTDTQTRSISAWMWERVALDRSFWKALERVCGWKKKIDSEGPKTWQWKAITFCNLVYDYGDKKQFSGDFNVVGDETPIEQFWNENL